MGTWTVAHQQLFLDVQLHDMHLEHVGAHVLAEGTEIVHDALHLYRTLAHSRWRHRFRPDRSKPGDAEFVGFIAITPLTFPLRHGILAGGECEPIDPLDQIFRGQVNHTLAGADEVVGGLAHLAQAEHATPAQPPCRRHWRQVRRAVWV